MKADVKQLWLEALPRYKQAKKALRDNEDGFCCLGVACDIYKEFHQGSRWSEPDNNFRDNHGGLGVGTPTIDVIRWMFDEEDMPGFHRGQLINREIELPFHPRKFSRLDVNREDFSNDKSFEQYVTLASANDHGCTFDQIADLIKHFL